MARRQEKQPKTEAEPEKPTLAGIVGTEPKVRPLRLFKPNSWNPNQLSPEKYEALKEILRTKGWARSDALLVWGTNEDGKRQNLIINGEHRWRAAQEIGMTAGPVVELRGISRKEAVQWTIRLDKLHGDFEPERLRRTLRDELDFRNTDDVFAVGLGFNTEEASEMRKSIPALGGRGARDAGLMLDDEEQDIGLMIETTELRSEFYMSVYGPVPEQPGVLELVRKRLGKIPGLKVNIGVKQKGEPS